MRGTRHSEEQVIGILKQGDSTLLRLTLGKVGHASERVITVMPFRIISSAKLEGR